MTKPQWKLTLIIVNSEMDWEGVSSEMASFVNNEIKKMNWNGESI
jgi:hypothetical protein